MPFEALLNSAQGKTALTVALSGAAGGALVGALTGNKTAKTLLKTGGLIAVGGIAMKAWQTYSNKSTDADGLLLVLRSMISAAHADGHLSEQEQKKIWNKSVKLGLLASDLAVISEALHQPLDQAEIAVLATTLEARIEVFTAAAIVIDDNCIAGQNYLDNLGTQLDLPIGRIDALKLQASAAA